MAQWVGLLRPDLLVDLLEQAGGYARPFPWREPLALKMGADAYLPSGECLPERVASALGGPPDVVFECAGAPGLIEQAVNLVRPRGTAVIAGGCMEPDSFVPALAMFKEVLHKHSF